MQLTDKFLNQAPKVINEGVHTDFNGGDHGGIAPVFNVRKVRQHRGGWGRLHGASALVHARKKMSVAWSIVGVL